MEVLGRVDHGVIVPQGGECLPEGLTVRIVYDPDSLQPAPSRGRPVNFPLVHTGERGTPRLTNQMIAEIFDEEDFSS